ncbi:beta-lactamase inducer [Clostridioides difficile]|uniref:M56 family metallopeptidase n=1 Tax=Clostridioides difficile TaxID=1496 RepID=UPI0010272023|nr:M56 family metallopeptidase [Clostridioides difficile]VFF93649.1 beta-lactamase inducer [Clostridioides difficile]VIG08723.1 beta-lactamase inducer [Clostridioides difficile]HBF4772709.1 M56 family metallopeptidase [Clostridioides difficile]HBF5038258.1 M56 family metallopeptidase [Clostridioides difficile]HBF5411116.1 M56 family metallopeptidase [Clostridioides difficile]
MELFIEVLKLNIYISIPILLFILFTKKVNRYGYKFYYLMCILIIFRMLFISKINLNILAINNDIIKSYKHSIDSYISYGYSINLDIFMYIWILGIILISFYYLKNNFKFYSYVENLQEEVLDVNIINVLDEQVKKLNINRGFKVYRVKGIYSPAIIGLRDYKIIIPEKEYNNRELNFIFRHELVHYKRKDNLFKAMISLVCTIYWFNPICHLLKKQFNELCELSCDEIVIDEYTSSEVEEYAYLILDTIKYKKTLRYSTCVSQFRNEKNIILKKRLNRMFNKDKKKINLGFKFLLTFIIVGSMFSINANSEPNENILGDISGKISYNKNGETYGPSVTDSNGNLVEPELIQALGIGKKVGYVRQRDLYDCDNQPKTPEEAVLYTRKRSFNIFKKSIPLYDKEGIKIIGRFKIN